MQRAAQKQSFIPFKCDLYSLGRIAEQLLEIDELNDREEWRKKTHYIIQEMKCKDWYLRWDVSTLMKNIDEKFGNSSLYAEIFEINEGDDHLKSLQEKKESEEGLSNMQKIYKQSELPNDQLNTALMEFQKCQSLETLFRLGSFNHIFGVKFN